MLIVKVSSGQVAEAVYVRSSAPTVATTATATVDHSTAARGRQVRSCRGQHAHEVRSVVVPNRRQTASRW